MILVDVNILLYNILLNATNAKGRNRQRRGDRLSTEATDQIRQLIRGSFKNIGYWQLDLDCRPHFIGEAPADAGVYAFTVDGEICYIGSAQGGLHRRLRKYNNPNNKGVVAVRVRGHITDALRSGAEVRVLATTCVPIAWNGLPIDPIVGLEEGLIRALRPAWNLRGLAKLRNPS